MDKITPTFDLIVGAAVEAQCAHGGEDQLCNVCAAQLAIDGLPDAVVRIALAEIVAHTMDMYSVE